MKALDCKGGIKTVGPYEQRIANETKLSGQILPGFIHLYLREASYSRLEIGCKHLF